MESDRLISLSAVGKCSAACPSRPCDAKSRPANYRRQFILAENRCSLFQKLLPSSSNSNKNET